MNTTNKRHGLVDVMLCVNNENGMTEDHVQAVEIPDFINLVGDESFVLTEDGFMISGKEFPYHHYEGNVGNIFWDCAWVTPIAAANLLNFLRERGDWDCEEAESHIWKKWESGEPITPEDFKNAA